MKIVIATSNKGKVSEINALLARAGLEILTLADFPKLNMPEETGATFRENAELKALFVAKHTGFVALADDSGLVVDFLGGRPGVRSARYAGEGASDADNYLKLLDELKGVAEKKRGARFVCVMALARPDGAVVTFEGALEGRIAEAPSGDNGFGYDPVFYIGEKGRTAAELASIEKNAISHRGAALRKLKDWMRGNQVWLQGAKP